MTDVVMVALIAAVPPTLLALGTLIVSWRNSTKVDRVESKVDGHLTTMTQELKDARSETLATRGVVSALSAALQPKKNGL